MAVTCNWCDRGMRPPVAIGGNGDEEARGICDVCAKKLVLPTRGSAIGFLHSLDAPVFVADGDARFIAANGAARELAGGDPAEIEGWLAGDVFDCAWAGQAGGCGQSECCRACTIKSAISETIEKGRNVSRRKAYVDRSVDGRVLRDHFLVSTLRAGDAVLLRLDKDT